MTNLDELLHFALLARPERVDDGILALLPPPQAAAVRQTRAAVGYLGRALESDVPSPDLKKRLLHTLEHTSANRALLVVDMINDHLMPGSTLEVPRAREIIPALQQRIADARRSGIPIVYVLDEHEPDDSDLEEWGTHAVRGSVGAEVWSDIAPREGDRIVRKPSYSAFFQSNLEPLLDELGIDTLVLTGCLTEMGLLQTAGDALQRGYAVELPPDSQAGSCVEAEMVALSTVRAMAPFGPARAARLERLAA
jgi:nicotinamidase-related amidase